MEDGAFSGDNLSDSDIDCELEAGIDEADIDSEHTLHEQSWLYSSDVAVRPLFDGSETTVLQALVS